MSSGLAKALGVTNGSGGGEGFELDVAEPDALAFGLEGDVAEGEGFGDAGFEERGDGGDVAGGIELGFLVAEDFGAVDAVDDLVVAVDFDFDFDPVAGLEGGCGGFDDVLGDEFAVDFEVGAGGADVSGGAFAFSFVGEELEFEADGEGLVGEHALGGLGVDHDAAVEVYVAWGIGDHFAFEAVFEAEEVV